MKAAWTRLARWITKQGGETRFMEPRFDSLFCRHHKNADELVFSTKDKRPMAAVYFTPAGRHPEDLRRLMAALRDRVSETACDASHDTDSRINIELYATAHKPKGKT